MKNKLTQQQAEILLSMTEMAEWYAMRAKQEKFIDYRHEAGAIITEHDTAAMYIVGEVGKVEFPEEVIWNLHKTRPGYVFKLAHTHGPQMDQPSSRDLQTLQTWAFALHPFPMRLSVIALKDRDRFVEKTYMGTIEPKEEWLARGKGLRNTKIVLESTRFFKPSLLDNGNAHHSWLLQLLKESYGKEAN